MKDVANMKALALALDVSVSTVSRALTDHYQISEKTKRKVLDMAEQMNYVPNAAASNLRRRYSKTIALVIPEVSENFFSQVINGVEYIAQENGYHVLIYLTHDNFVNEQSILKNLNNGRVDGVIIFVSSETDHSFHVRQLQAKKIPVIFLGRVCDDIDTAKITTNDFENGKNAALHLINQGCKNISLLTISKSMYFAQPRLEGFRTALRSNGFPFIESNIIYGTKNEEENHKLLTKLMTRKTRPDGIIATGETLTIGAYTVCHELKLFIPGDVKLISLSNIASAKALSPALTTFTQPAFDMGKTAAGVLFNQIKTEPFSFENENILMESSLMIRESTK